MPEDLSLHTTVTRLLDGDSCRTVIAFRFPFEFGDAGEGWMEDEAPVLVGDVLEFKRGTELWSVTAVSSVDGFTRLELELMP